MRALGHRDYRLFFAGQIVSLIGTWMQSVGQAWLVLELTNSPFKLGLLGTLQFGPMLLFAFLSARMLQPLKTLTAAAGEVAQGNLDVPLPRPRGGDDPRPLA